MRREVRERGVAWRRFTACEDAFAALPKHDAPQVLLLDVELPGMSGIEALAHLRQQASRTALVILTVFEDDDKIFRAICAGASGYLLKTSSIEDIATARKALPELNTNGYELEEVKARIDNTFRLKVTERSTSAASHVDVPGELFGSPSYGSLRRAYEKAAEAVGLPPFTITLGKKSRRAETFGELKSLTLELAKEGIQVARFKGLGEMDPAELWDTTMDPARRMLMRVEVEDAAEADRIFSMLMGDQVEPRREFIEQNAQDVRFLDV